MIDGILVGVCIGLFIISVLCAFLSILAYAKVIGFENSTHQIEYRDPRMDLDDDEVEEDFNPFAVPPSESDKEIDPLEEEKRKKAKAKEERLLRGALIGDEGEEFDLI